MSIDTQVRPPDAERKVFGVTIPSRSGGGAPVVVGGQPRANLLPPEIILKRKQLKTRRSLRAGVLLVAVVVAALCVLTGGIGAAAQLQLAGSQQTQQELLKEQAKYGDVRDAQSTIATIIAGQKVGDSTEINWRDYLVKLQASLPEGVSLTTVTIVSGTPMIPFTQSNTPLEGSRVAELSFTATSATLPSIPDWLRSMAKLPGFVDATPGSVSLDGTSYTAQVVMHINADAFSHRLDPAAAKSTDGAATGDTTATDNTTEGQ